MAHAFETPSYPWRGQRTEFGVRVRQSGSVGRFSAPLRGSSMVLAHSDNEALDLFLMSYALHNQAHDILVGNKTTGEVAIFKVTPPRPKPTPPATIERI